MKRFLIKIIKVILFLLCIAMLVLTTPISIVVDLGNQIEKLVINFQEFLFTQVGFFVDWLDKIEKGKEYIVMNEDLFKGMFIGACATLIILGSLALASGGGFTDKQLLQLNLAIERGINNAR